MTATQALLLKGAHVIDPAQGIDGVRDIAIENGKIRPVEGLPPDVPTIDLTGSYLTPGWIDIHVHVYAGVGIPGSYAGDNSVYPDDHAFKACTTTMVDAGSSGHLDFEDFKQRILRSERAHV